MKTLLRLQELDLEIESCINREREIPLQKSKFDVQKKRLRAELEEGEETYRKLQIEQRALEHDNEQMQAQVAKYEQQLLTVKKNEEYQALLHEIDNLKKQIGQKEERIIAVMLDLDDAKVRIEEDRERIRTEMERIDRQAAEMDKELEGTIRDRTELEVQREPLTAAVEADLLAQYDRIRSRLKSGPAVVPIRNDFCSGCNMAVRPQVINEVLAGRPRTCTQCGRLLYHKDTVNNESSEKPAG